MAYLLRSLAVIGAIALNSPVHGTKSEDGGAGETLRTVAKVASQLDVKTAASGLTAAREAAQIMAGLDPQTRSRVLALALGTGAAKPEHPTRSAN
jgi:hypothetical protein